MRKIILRKLIVKTPMKIKTREFLDWIKTHATDKDKILAILNTLKPNISTRETPKSLVTDIEKYNITPDGEIKEIKSYNTKTRKWEKYVRI